MTQFVEKDLEKSSDVQSEMKNGVTAKKKCLFMDEAITQTKFGFFNYAIMINGGLIMSALVMEKVGITYIFPVSQCDLNLTSGQKGFLGSVGFIGIILSSHMWGYLADTLGRRRIIQPTLLIASVISIISSFAQSFYLLAALRFLNGFFISASSATIFVYLGEFHNSRNRTNSIMGASIAAGFICILLPFIAWIIINQEWQFDIFTITYKPWRLYLAVCSIPGLISFGITTFLPESPKFVLGQGKQAETYQILQEMNRLNNGKKSELEAFEILEEVESIENRKHMLAIQNSRYPCLASVWHQTVPLFKKPYLSSTILVCLIQFSIFYTSQGFNVFYAEILNKMALNADHNPRGMMCDIINIKPLRLNSTITGGNITVCVTKLEMTTLQQGTISQALYGGAYFIVGLLINRVSKFSIIFSILAGSGACGIACVLVDLPWLQTSLLTLLVASGTGSNVLNTATVGLYPTTIRGMALCISMMFGRFGSIMGSNIAAILLASSCTAAFYLSGAILIAAGIVTFFIPNIHQRVNKSESH